ncbi:aconitase X swivel domain-containing protein [Chloroflexota bacterium]
MREITLRGRSAAKGMAEGEALVSPDMICFLSDIDNKTGVISEPTFKLKGQSIVGKILVFPTGRGSTGDPYGTYMLGKAGMLPKAIVNVEANPTTVSGAVISNIPMVYHLDRNPLEVIETGDYVKVDGNQGVVVVTKRG